MHTIGIEHEGFAAQGATWFTESMYRNSAKLVQYLAAKYDIPLDRAHIIGHDQVPGIIPSNVAGMHWDPGPYWDWEHYFDLLGAPICGTAVPVRPATSSPSSRASPTTCRSSATATRRPRRARRRARTSSTCAAPSDDAPLVKDIGLHPDGSAVDHRASPTSGPRAAAGQKFVVVKRRATGSRSGGSVSSRWFKNPTPPAIRSCARAGPVVEPKAARPGAGLRPRVPGAGGVPGGYPVPDGHAAAVHDQAPARPTSGRRRDIETDYYYAKTFDGSLPDDHTVVRRQGPVLPDLVRPPDRLRPRRRRGHQPSPLDWVL